MRRGSARGEAYDMAKQVVAKQVVEKQPLARQSVAKQPLGVDLLVGRNIRIFRLQRGLTQSDLGGHLGVTPQQIQKYENGANRVGASRLSQLAGALGVPLATLFDGQPGRRNGRRTNGHATNGHAGNGHADPDIDGGALLANRHALRLARAFEEIPVNRRRLAILRLVEALGNGHATQPTPPRRRRGVH
jgi:transcriptional regulator with XRE-family HTH domain